MKTKIILKLLLIAVLFTGLFLVNSCGKLSGFLTGATTNLTSNSLAAATALRAQGITIAGSVEGNNYLITPTKISGEVMSIVLPIAGQADNGITPFGNNRPDIAPADSALQSFDLSVTTTLPKKIISYKTNAAGKFDGGNCNQIILMFGYFDVEFLQDTTTKKIRFYYGNTDTTATGYTYIRGDKMMHNPSGTSTDGYYWYDTLGSTFSLTRPASPAVNAYVRDWEDDPIRPDSHYYMLGAQLKDCTDYDDVTKDYITLSDNIVRNFNMSFTVDFDVTNSVIFDSCSSEAEFFALTDAQLIQKFDMKQNTSGWGDSNLDCSISFETTSLY
ncbi:MAG: hypothetical protein HQ564_06030 [Candidatus Saganbacteria bacterium]|nr:hypothetical protein [Candidatus Saganbacteria bacterium]